MKQHTIKQGLLSLSISLFISSTLAPQAQAYADITIASETSDSQLLAEAKSQQQSLFSKQQKLLAQQNTYRSGADLLWGRNSVGDDMTWMTLWGFAIPGLAQLFYVFDDRAPAWLRITGVAQWLSLGVASWGGVQAYQNDQLGYIGHPAAQPMSDDNLTLIISGVSAYTALALVPSSIVGIHDGVVDNDNQTKLKNTNTDLAQINSQLARLEPAIKILENAESGDYQAAIAASDALDLEIADTYQIDSQRVLAWKQKDFQQAYLPLKYSRQSAAVKAEQIKGLLEHPYIHTAPEIQAELKAALPDLQKEADALQRTQQARESALEKENARQDIYNQAYELAKEGDFYEAVEKLDEYDWQPNDPQYALVKEKRKTWGNAWYSMMYKYAYNLASDGDVEKALSVFTDLESGWPTAHPDFKRVKQKIKDWRFIMEKKNKTQIKHGFLNAEQIRILKEKNYPIIMSSDFPNSNAWRHIATVRSTLNEYTIMYYDPSTLKSFTIIGGNLCGRLSQSLTQQVLGNTQSYISNPVLGRIGLNSLGYADAYYTTNMGKSKANCYTVVTPGNLESWMTDYSGYEGINNDVPSNLKRLSKTEFTSVLKNLKYLP